MLVFPQTNGGVTEETITAVGSIDLILFCWGRDMANRLFPFLRFQYFISDSTKQDNLQVCSQFPLPVTIGNLAECRTVATFASSSVTRSEMQLNFISNRQTFPLTSETTY